MTPSHDDKLIEQAAKFISERDAVWGEQSWSDDGEELPKAFAEFASKLIAETRKQTLEEAAKLAVAWANKCDDHGTKHFCDYFGCQSFDKLAAEIRLLSSPASTNSIHATASDDARKENDNE